MFMDILDMTVVIHNCWSSKAWMHNAFWKSLKPSGLRRSNYQAEKDNFSTAGQPAIAFLRSSQCWLLLDPARWPDHWTSTTMSHSVWQCFHCTWSGLLEQSIPFNKLFFLNILLWEFLWGQYYSYFGLCRKNPNPPFQLNFHTLLRT